MTKNPELFPMADARSIALVCANEASLWAELRLRAATIAIASTGTVTMECAFFKVPTVALYKTSWLTYQIGKRIVTVNHLAMPNLLAGKVVFPEFVQDAATGKNLAAAALDLLRNPARRVEMQSEMGSIIGALGATGANLRAAKAVWSLLGSARR